MVRKYIGNGQWADVPGTAPTKTTTNLDLDAALEEVATRFLVHLPRFKLQSGDRLFFQIEQAHWFYEDFLADADGSSYPTYTYESSRPSSSIVWNYSNP